MQRAWLSLLGVLGIVISCLGFTMNRSDARILVPGLWPGSPFHTDRRAAIKMFFNGKIHAADVDNILRDTESKKSVNGEEKCSSCSEDPLRVKRSGDISHPENQRNLDNRNASNVKESPNMSSSTLKSKSSDVTSKPKIPDATLKSKISDVVPKSEPADPTSESKNSDEASKSKISDVIPKSETADPTSGSKNSDATSESKTSDVIPKSETADLMSRSKNSDVIPKSETADLMSRSKNSDVIPKSEISDPTSGFKNSNVANTKSKTSDVILKFETSHVMSESKTSHVTTESKLPHVSKSKDLDFTSEKSPNNEVLRNVVLLLIDHGPNQETIWKNFGAAYEFPVHGFIQNCRRSEPSEEFKFGLGEFLAFGKKDECECDRLLRANVGSLLSWARHAKNMTTGAVSATNFSIPSPLDYESWPSQSANDLEDEINSPKQDALRTHNDLRTNWRLVELQKQSSLSSSTPTVIPESVTKVDGVNGFDGIWDVFDMFSRIRIAFFRILLESLGNLTGFEDEFSGRRPILVQPNVAELVSDTVRELKSMPNENGFIMVVAAPGNEMSAVVEVLQREVTPDNTLLVISGMCSSNNESVPFFANGPGRKSLQEGFTVWELPRSIKDAISNDCHGHTCINKLPDESFVLPSVELLSSPNDIPRKRIARAKEEDETTLPTGDDKTTKDLDDIENNSDEKTTIPEMEKRSGAEILKVDNVAAILGIATSITAMLALNS